MYRTKQEFESETEASSESEISERDLHVCVVALAVEVGQVDGTFGPDEICEAVRGMNREFNLGDAEAGELIEIAQFLRKEPGKIEPYFSKMEQALTVEQKQRVLEILWRTIAADQEITRDEAALAVTMRKRLGLSLELAMQARQNAEKVRTNPADSDGEEE